MNEINKILKWVIYGLAFLIPLVAFVVPHNMFFPYITGKAFVFRLIVELMFGTWLVLALRDKDFRPKWSWLSVAITVFTLIVAVADIFSENPFKSFWSNFERMDGFVTILHLWAYFMVLGTVFKTEGIWTRLINYSVGTSVLMCLVAIPEIVQNPAGYRIFANLGNPVYLAVYLLINILLAIFLFYRVVARAGGLQKIFKVGLTYVYIPIILFQSYILYHTSTRGSILGLMGGLVLASLLIVIFEKRDLLLKRVSLGIIVLIIIAVGVFIPNRKTDFVMNNPVLSRFAAISWKGETLQARSMVWPMAWQGVKERPLLGWGQESFNFVFNKYYNPGMYSQEQWFDRTHNVFLDWLIAAGFLGCLSYLSIFGVTIWLLWRFISSRTLLSWNNVKRSLTTWSNGKELDEDEEETSAQYFSVGEIAILTGLLAAYFFHNLFVFDNLISYILFFTLLAYIHAQENARPIAQIQAVSDKIKYDDEVRDYLLVPVAIILTVLIGFWFNFGPYMQNQSLIKALNLAGQGQTDAALKEFKNTLSYKTLGDAETREQLMSFANSTINSTTITDKTKQEVFAFVTSELQKQVELVPNDARYQLFTGVTFGSYHLWEQGLPFLLRAEKLSPNKQTIKMEIVSNYLNQGKMAEALAEAKATFDLAPDFREARIIYAITLFYNKQNALAENILVGAKDSTVFQDNRVMSAYLSNGGLEPSIKELRKQISASPKDLSLRYKLVNIYISANKKTEAIVEIENMVKIDPTLRDQADAYIKQLQGK